MKNLFWALLALFTIVSCTKEETTETPEPTTPTGSMSIKFDPYWGDDNLVLGNTYTNAFGEEFTPNVFKYYVSNVSLINADGSRTKIENTYFLVDHSEGAPKWTIDNIPTGEYTGFELMIGVDSTRNVSGAQEGALDPANQMFWSWNNGYIFYKLEGTSPAVADSAKTVKFHIGGFQSPNNTRWIHTSFDVGGHSHLKSEKLVTISPDATPSVHYHVQLDNLFKQTNSKPLAEKSKQMAPTEEAGEIADLYSTIFVVDHVHE